MRNDKALTLFVVAAVPGKSTVSKLQFAQNTFVAHGACLAFHVRQQSIFDQKLDDAHIICSKKFWHTTLPLSLLSATDGGSELLLHIRCFCPSLILLCRQSFVNHPLDSLLG